MLKLFITLLFLSILSFNSMLNAQKKAYIATGGALYLADIESCAAQFLGSTYHTTNYLVSWDDIALNPLTDTLYGVSQLDTLYWIDKTNGRQHFIGATLPNMNGLTFGKDGTLYGMAANRDNLFTINPYTGVWTDLGRIGTPFFPGSNGDLAFHNDTLYYLGNNSATSTPLIKINLGDLSQSSVVGVFDESLMYGLASLGCNMSLYSFNQRSAYQVHSLSPFQYDTICYNFLPIGGFITGAAGINEDIGVPILNLGDDQLVCLGDTIFLDVTSSTGKYLWHNNDTIPTFNITQAGDYWVEIQNDSCIVRDTISAIYETPPILDLPDTTLCDGQTLLVDLSNYNLNYTWFNGTTSPIFQVNSGGTYTVTATGGICNVVLTDAIRLDYKTYPLLVLDSVYNLCVGEQLTLNAYQDDVRYLWQDNSTTDSFLVTQAGTYAVEVTNYCGTVRQEIEVLENCNCISAIPDAFSPNNDGYNDFFRPILSCPLQAARLRIFNRWGQTVCDTHKITIGWDGFFKGVACPQEAYIYLLEFKEVNNPPKAIKGALHLLH